MAAGLHLAFGKTGARNLLSGYRVAGKITLPVTAAHMLHGSARSISTTRQRVSDLQVLTSRKTFESMVFARLASVSGTIVDKFTVNSESQVEHYENRFGEDGLNMVRAWPQMFAFASGQKHPDKKTCSTRIGHEYELDLCIQLDETQMLESILKDCCEPGDILFSGFKGSGIDYSQVAIKEREYMYMEIVEESSHLSRKLFQLERGVHMSSVWHPEDAPPIFGAVCVLLNGEREAALKAVKDFQHQSSTFQSCMLYSVPLIIGFTPYRNVFSELRRIAETQEAMVQKQEAMVHALANLTEMVKELAKPR